MEPGGFVWQLQVWSRTPDCERIDHLRGPADFIVPPRPARSVQSSQLVSLQKKRLDLIHPSAQSYAEQHTSPASPLLQEVAAYTLANHAHHTMLSGHLQGKWLEMVSWMIRPRRVLEIGTFTG